MFEMKILSAIKVYCSLESRIARLEKDIIGLQNQIGRDYHNPLGTAFDVYDDQNDHDDFISNLIDLKKKKIETLKNKIL